MGAYQEGKKVAGQVSRAEERLMKKRSVVQAEEARRCCVVMHTVLTYQADCVAESTIFFRCQRHRERLFFAHLFCHSRHADIGDYPHEARRAVLLSASAPGYCRTRLPMRS